MLHRMIVANPRALPRAMREFATMVAAIGLLAQATIASAAAQTPPRPPSIVVSDAWARATSPIATTGAAYLTLTDNGAPDRLIGASTPMAGTADLHQTINAAGVMQMRPVAGLDLQAGSPVALTPGSYHVMLMDLKHPLHQGDSFPLTLLFAHAAPVTVQVRIEGPGASAPAQGMKGMDMSGAHKP